MSPASVQPYHLQPDILKFVCMYILMCAGLMPEGLVCVRVVLFLIKSDISAFWVGRARRNQLNGKKKE